MAFRDYGSVLKCACLAAGLAWFAGCEGTETTNPKVTDNDPPGLHGRLVDGAGQPRAGVSVKAFQVEKSPLGKAAPKSAAASDTTVTDARGDYNFDSLQGGRYNLIGEYNGGGLVVLIPQIEYQGGASERNLGTDTLRLPGRITGSIRLGGKGREGVFCYLTGTSFLSLSDETGKFWFYGIPQGEYDLNLAYPGLQTAKDTGILVKAGETTVLQPRELGYDTAFPPPAPDSLRVAYDTLSGVVTLSWSRSQVADVDGYVVYRIDPLTSSPQRLNTALVRDTVFRDTLFRGSGDTASLVAAYQVKSQDRTTNRSTVFSPLVSVVCIPPGQVRTSLKMAMRTATGDIAVMRDTLRFIATYANPIRR
ncbi:MAG TPA: carboxypeptidase-like regulatory domain-containing protein, partial [Fibrobacteria bacterium]|nr:carboxypeptidase-like regulatory domain-containing protein [Fibrobacteria bacterium]